MDAIGFVWLIPAIMALAALVNGVFCKRLGALAGLISAGAMGSTFIIATLVFMQVKSAAPHIAHGAHEGGDHAATEHAHAATHSADAGMNYWNGLSHEGQEAMKAQYTFIRVADPANVKPWETEFRGGQGGYVSLWRWIDIPAVFSGEKSMVIDLALHVDQLTAVFLMFVSFVGTLVFIYATGYMKEERNGHVVLDEGYARFFSYMALFAASMYTLVLGANFAVMFIGWEGVGLCSYLLIGYYYDRPFSEKLSCSDAGKKAFVANRVGDFGLILGMGLLFWGLGTLDFQEVIHKLSVGEVPAGFGYNGAIITAAALLLFLGATGKSAQIPLFIWLPDAMAGPTPVSALIHAATMVTAGVYMLARLNVLYMLAPSALVVIAVIGAATAFVAAVVGLTQRGIKKILAYSTVSQLGFMFLAIGVGGFAVGIFHVFTHAFFKACLFLAAGSIIHALHHEEDVFKMGGLKSKMPLTFLAYLSATLAIAGIVPFAGFFSKDEILYFVYMAGQGNGFYTVLWVLAVLTAIMTAFYMGRSLFLAFFGKTRMAHAGHDDHHHDHRDDHGHDAHAHHGVEFEKVKESPLSITGVLMVLAVASLVVGFFNVPKGLLPLGDFNSAFHHFLEPVTDRGVHNIATQFHGYTGAAAPYGPIVVGNVTKDGAMYFGYHGPEVMLAVVSVLLAALGLGIAWVLYGSGDLSKSEKMKRAFSPLWNISWNGWWWDDINDSIFVRGFMRLYAAVLWFDKKVVDGAVNGVGSFARSCANEFRRLQNGQVQVYGLVMFIGVCLFVLYFALGLATFLEKQGPRLTPPPATKISAPAAPAVTALATD